MKQLDRPQFQSQGPRMEDLPQMELGYCIHADELYILDHKILNMHQKLSIDPILQYAELI